MLADLPSTFETFILPESNQMILLVLLGITGQGLAYLFWDHGIKNGYYKFLCALTYAAPILSIFLLVQFGYTTMSQHLLIATLLVSLGAVITTPQFKGIGKTISKFKKISRTISRTATKSL